MSIKTDLVNGRDLKVGSVFIPAGEETSFYKITGLTTSKPGKHGSAKSIITARNLINNKNLSGTFKDTDEKILQVLDFDYQFKVVYAVNGSEICTNLESGEYIYTQSFEVESRARLEEAVQANVTNGKGLVDEKGSPLCLKYSEVLQNDAPIYIFWELVYIPVEELPKHGIPDYLSTNKRILFIEHI